MIQNQVPSHKDQDMITGNDVHDDSSSTGSEATPTASQGIAKLESRIKAAQVELDRIHVEAKGEDIDAALEAASKIENRIVTMKKHLDALVDKAAIPLNLETLVKRIFHAFSWMVRPSHIVIMKISLPWSTSCRNLRV